MFTEILPDLSLRPCAIAQEQQRLLERPFARILGLQRLDLAFFQLLADSQPGGYDAGKPEGIFTVQVDVHPGRGLLLDLDGGNLFHKVQNGQAANQQVIKQTQPKHRAESVSAVGQVWIG